VCFANRLRRDTEPNSGLGVGHPFPIHSRQAARQGCITRAAS
jgi:hypothetical protein